jgi:hypothetical protein
MWNTDFFTCPLRYKKSIPWETPKWNHKQWGRIVRHYWTMQSLAETRVTSSHKAGCQAGEDLRIKTSHTGLLLCLSLAFTYKNTSKPANTSAKLGRLKCNRKNTDNSRSLRVWHRMYNVLVYVICIYIYTHIFGMYNFDYIQYIILIN